MKPETIRLHAPTSIVFLCGGVMGDKAESPQALRDAFFRLSASATLPYRIILAEDAQPLTTDAGYGDLLTFEADIAQVVGLILLFAESAGSLAELGAFAALPTVAPNLLAVIDDVYYNNSSFIRHGPVQFLEAFGDGYVLQLEREYLSIEPGNISDINLSRFGAALFGAIDERLNKKVKSRPFERPSRATGDAILIATGLCQEFGALLQSEIKEFLSILGADPADLKRVLYCAELLNWIKRVKKGHNVYYVGMPGDSALTFSLSSAIAVKDKLRLRADAREHWKNTDLNRFRAITDVLTSGGGGVVA